MNVNADDQADCPVSLDMLGRLYRAEPSLVGDIARTLSDVDRARLALFCYSRAHLRAVALTVAASCEASSLVRLAGTMGQVLSAQSAESCGSFGRDALRSGSLKRKVSLARSAA